MPTVPGLYCAALGLVRYFKGPRKRAMKRVWKLAHYLHHWPLSGAWTAAALTALTLYALVMLPPMVPRKRRNASRTPEPPGSGV